jgi:folylpolyglutamate synthase/dihydropteroate synthase
MRGCEIKSDFSLNQGIMLIFGIILRKMVKTILKTLQPENTRKVLTQIESLKVSNVGGFYVCVERRW